MERACFWAPVRNGSSNIFKLNHQFPWGTQRRREEEEERERGGREGNEEKN